MQRQRKELKSTTLIYAKLPACGNTAQHLRGQWERVRGGQKVWREKKIQYSVSVEKEAYLECSTCGQIWYRYRCNLCSREKKDLDYLIYPNIPRLCFHVLPWLYAVRVWVHASCTQHHEIIHLSPAHTPLTHIITTLIKKIYFCCTLGCRGTFRTKTSVHIVAQTQGKNFKYWACAGFFFGKKMELTHTTVNTILHLYSNAPWTADPSPSAGWSDPWFCKLLMRTVWRAAPKWHQTNQAFFNHHIEILSTAVV